MNLIDTPCEHCGAKAGELCSSSCSHLWWPWVFELLARAGVLNEARKKAQ